MIPRLPHRVTGKWTDSPEAAQCASTAQIPASGKLEWTCIKQWKMHLVVNKDLEKLQLQSVNSSKVTQILAAWSAGTKQHTTRQSSLLSGKERAEQCLLLCGLCPCWLMLQLPAQAGLRWTGWESLPGVYAILCWDSLLPEAVLQYSQLFL